MLPVLSKNTFHANVTVELPTVSVDNLLILYQRSLLLLNDRFISLIVLRVEIFASAASFLEEVITNVSVTYRFLLQQLNFHFQVVILAMLHWFAKVQFNLICIVYAVWLELICHTRISLFTLYAL